MTELTTSNTKMTTNTLTVSSIKDLPQDLQKQLEGLNITENENLVIHLNCKVKKPRQTPEERKAKINELARRHYENNKEKISEQRKQQYRRRVEEQKLESKKNDENLF